MPIMKSVLSIAGTDPSGGAGIHADLKTFAAHKVYGMGVITAIVAQNTCGVTAVEKASAAILRAQLEAVFADIFPDAVKIGMVPDAGAMDTVASALRSWKPRNIVLDPVMVSTSRHRLLDEGAEADLIRQLLPLANLVTPNIPEAGILCGFSVRTKDDMVRAAEKIAGLCAGAVLLKGGHLEGDCDDLLFMDGKTEWFSEKRIETRNTHGTGCTLSSAIAANLALGMTISGAVGKAKTYLTAAIRNAPGLGKGKGPLNHSAI